MVEMVRREAWPFLTGGRMFSLVSLPARFRSLSIVRQVALITFFAQMVFYLPALTPYLLRRGLDLTAIATLQSIVIWSQLVLEVPTGWGITGGNVWRWCASSPASQRCCLRATTRRSCWRRS